MDASLLPFCEQDFGRTVAERYIVFEFTIVAQDSHTDDRKGPAPGCQHSGN